MTIQPRFNPDQVAPQAKPPRYRYKPLTAAVCAVLLLGANTAFADDDVASLKAQIEQLKSQLAASQQQTAVTPATDVVNHSAPANQTPDATATDTTKKDDTPDSIEVTGKRKNKQQQALEILKDVPKSISVVSGQQLDQQAATSMTAVLQRLGDVSFNYGNPRTGSLSMRGITTSSSDTIQPSIGVVIDGVPIAYTGLANALNFVDIDTISTDRGPQGTTGGKDYSVGQIVINNKLPTFKNEAEASLTYGQLNTLNSTLIAGGTVIPDLLAWRGTFLREQGDGPATNADPAEKGRTSYDNTDITYGRVQFLLTPTDNLTAHLSLEEQPNGSSFINGYTQKLAQPLTYSDGTAISATKINAAPDHILTRGWFTNDLNGQSASQYLADHVDQDDNGAIITNVKGVTGDIDYKGNGYDLKSITSYRSTWFSAANDEGTIFNVTNNGGYITNFDQLSQEFKLISGWGKLVDYTTGLYFLSTKDDSLSRTNYGSDGGAYYATGDGTVGNGQYGILVNNANAALNSSGSQLLTNSLNNLYKGTYDVTTQKDASWYGSADWHLADPTTLTTGLRLSREDNTAEQSSLIYDQGDGSALNPVNVNNVQLSGFSSSSTGALASTNSSAQIALANQVAQQYFGISSYNALSAAQKLQVANAKAVRAGQTTGLYNLATAQPFDKTIKSWDVSLKQKLTDEVTAYGTVQYGEKGGISQINGSDANGGISALVKPEQTTNYELGIHSDWLAKTLTFNADVFQSNIKNFQQTVSYLDPVLTALNGSPTYSSGPGSVPGVRIRGLEIDSAYTGIQHLLIRFSGAYNNAIYTNFPNEGLASELDPAQYAGGFYNVSGKTLPNAPKVTSSLGAEYNIPLLAYGVQLHTSANYKWTSRYNEDPNLSSYGEVSSYGLLDLGVGAGRLDGKLDVNLIFKNLTDKEFHNAGWTSYNIPNPRWVGVNIIARY